MPNIEELLRKAMEDRKFDNLPGKGKPLHLDENNPYTDSDWELAYHFLKEGGYSLPWIETRHAIENDIESARQELLRAWNLRQAALSTSQPSSYISTEWRRAQDVFKDRLIGLNQRIRDYNLEVPNARFQRISLNYEHELQLITGSEEKGI